MLDQVGLADAILFGISQDAAHHVQLVVTGEEQRLALLARLLVFLDGELGELLDDVGQAAARQNIVPEVGRFVAFRIDRVALAEVKPLVERQEIAVIPGQLGTHVGLVRVHRKVDQTAAKFEQRLTRIAVSAVLLDGVVDVLAGPGVFQLQRGNRQAIDKEHHVHRLEGVRLAVMHLPGDAEDVGRKVGDNFRVQVVVGQPVKQIEVGIIDVQSLLQDSQHAVLLDLFVQPLQKQALPARAILELRQLLGLRGFKELPKEFAVDGKLSVEVSRIANAVAALGKGVFDVCFERCFVGLADHASPLDLDLSGD